MSALPDVSGRTAIVTGANSGVGFHATKKLASAGASVVLACRNETKATEAAEKIQADVPEADLDVRRLDLADLSSVHTFADAYLQDHDRLDLLVNNAGVMAIPRQQTADGFEMQLGTNHLGHFALTGRLMPLLIGTTTGGSDVRVVTVSSLMHTQGTIHRDDLMLERGYGRMKAYAQSKLANLIFAAELQRRLSAAGHTVLSLGAHPGVVSSGLAGPPTQMFGVVGKAGEKIYNAFLPGAEGGAQAIVYAATSPDVVGGAYYGPKGPFAIAGKPGRAGRIAAAKDEDTARWLWEKSAELTGVDYL